MQKGRRISTQRLKDAKTQRGKPQPKTLFEQETTEATEENGRVDN
jgi:hypothetical protein